MFEYGPSLQHKCMVTGYHRGHHLRNNIMKKSSVLLIALLTGCSVQFNSWELLQADKGCESHGGVSLIRWAGFGSGWSSRAVCNDGTTFILDITSP
jgi:hypothetical protein